MGEVDEDFRAFMNKALGYDIEEHRRRRNEVLAQLRAQSAARSSPKMPDSARSCPNPQNVQNKPILLPDDAARGLSPRQLAAINLLFQGQSYGNVCRRLRIDPKTLYRWRRRDAFIAEVRRRYAAT